jgi:hypothetical protein
MAEMGLSVTNAVLGAVGGALAATILSYILRFVGLRLHRFVNEGIMISFEFKCDDLVNLLNERITKVPCPSICFWFFSV